MKRLKPRFAKFLLVATSLVLTLLALEVIVRQVGLLDREAGYNRRLYQVSRNPELLYEFRPNFQAPYGRPNPVTFKINSLGMRDREVSLKRPEGIYRIIVVGDSVTAGCCVALEETFVKQLEALLNSHHGSQRYEVLNCGVNGYNLLNERAYLESKGIFLEPNLIIVAYNNNDYRWQKGLNDLGLLLRTKDYHRSYYSPENHSELYIFLKVVYLKLKRRLFPSNYEWPPLAGWRWRAKKVLEFYSDQEGERWKQMKEDLLEMASLARRHEAGFLVIHVPERFQMPGGDLSDDLPQRVVGSHLEAHGIQYLDLLPAFQDYQRKTTKSLFLDSNHPTATGHTLIARELYRHLVSREPPLR